MREPIVHGAPVRARRDQRAPLATAERVASFVGGVALGWMALRRRGVLRVGMAIASGLLFKRALAGESRIYGIFGVGSARDAPTDDVSTLPEIRELGPRAALVERSITIGRPPDEVYAAFRDVASWPRFMAHVRAVEAREPTTWHWALEGADGGTIEFTVELVDDRPGEHVGWRTLADSDVRHAGAIYFTEAPGGRGTELKVVVGYAIPGGPIGEIAARALGHAPDQQVREDLRRFKQLVEAGETATVEGQPMGEPE
jgi:uncharacterized membrane protein